MKYLRKIAFTFNDISDGANVIDENDEWTDETEAGLRDAIHSMEEELDELVDNHGDYERIHQLKDDIESHRKLLAELEYESSLWDEGHKKSNRKLKSFEKFADDNKSIDKQTISNIKKSIRDEEKAVEDYTRYAESSTNKKAKQLWNHIKKEEMRHAKELNKLLKEVEIKKSADMDQSHWDDIFSHFKMNKDEDEVEDRELDDDEILNEPETEEYDSKADYEEEEPSQEEKDRIEIENYIDGAYVNAKRLSQEVCDIFEEDESDIAVKICDLLSDFLIATKGRNDYPNSHDLDAAKEVIEAIGDMELDKNNIAKLREMKQHSEFKELIGALNIIYIYA